MGDGASLLTLAGIGALTLVPFVFMASTSFVKLSFVLSILRNALGTGQAPSGMIITALATILTFYVMAPVADEMVQAAAPTAARVDLNSPLQGASRDALLETYSLGKEPLRAFLFRNSGQAERSMFVELARKSGRADVDPEGLMISLSAFLITELKEAFQIGFLIFVPFVVIDLVIANILLALGMHMVAPTTISLPFKLLLFVLVDGWYVLAEALVAGYR